MPNISIPTKVVHRVFANVTVDEDGCWISNYSTNRGGYSQVGYGENGKRKVANGHVIACRAAHGPKPFPNAHVRHSCHKPKCVNPKCLSWGTRQKNMDDMVAAGRQASGERNGFSKLTKEIVLDICARSDAGETQQSIARRYGIYQSTVHAIVSGKTWGHVTGRGRKDA